MLLTAKPISHYSQFEMQAEQIHRLTQIFRYLKEIDQIRNPVVRDVRSQTALLWFRDFPGHPAVEKGVAQEDAASESEDEATDKHDLPFVLRVGRAKITHCPFPPTSVADWLRAGWKEFEGEASVYEEKNIPIKDGTADFVRFIDDPERVSAFREWKSARDRWIGNERPARSALKVFEKIYEIWGQLEREGERLELVLGDGHLSISACGIKHPILLQRLTLEFDPKIPEFIFRPSSQPVELYDGLFLQIPGIEGQQKARITKELDEQQFQPLSTSDTDGFLKQIAQGLFAPHGEFIEDGEPQGESDHPRIGRSPVIFLRRRTLGFSTAVDSILVDIQSRDELPPALLRIAGFETDVAEVEIEKEVFYSGNEEDSTLLSKPANEEQLRIARRLRQNGCVLVQGPPGTGKTHTIANLLGHLLAEGKSVLVTAHTTKALRVLRNKVVEPLRPLCISVLENDAENNAQLNAAVQDIAARLSGTDADELVGQAAELQRKRRVIIEDIRKLRLELRDARYAEIEEIIIGGEGRRPIDAARQVKSGIGVDDWIPAPVTNGSVLPISQAECIQLYRTNTTITAGQEDELRELTEPELLLSPSEFAGLVSQRSALSNKDQNLRPELWGDSEIQHELDRFEDTLRRLLSVIEVARDTENWKLEVLRAGWQGSESRGVWEDLITLIEAVANEANVAQRVLMAHGPDLGKIGDLRATCVVLQEISQHMADGGSLGLWTQISKRHWSPVIALCSVRVGSTRIPPATKEHFEALHMLAKKLVSEDNLQGRWEAQIGGNGGPGAESLGPITNATQFVAPIRACLNWHQEDWQPVLSDLEQLGFRWNVYYAETPPELGQHAELQRLRKAVTGALGDIVRSRRDYLKIQAIDNGLQDYAYALQEVPQCRIARMMLESLCRLDANAYSTEFENLMHYRGLKSDFAIRNELLKRLEVDAPGWANAIRQRIAPHDVGTPPGNPITAWVWRQMHDELDRRAKVKPDEILRKIDFCSQSLIGDTGVTTQLIDRKTWAAQSRRGGQKTQAALQGYVDIRKKVTKTQRGKRDAALLKAAREQLIVARDAVPVWIMPLSQVHESFFRPGKIRQFDVVIIDEASQSDVSALVALYLGKEIIIVGDEEQVTPTSFTDLDKVQQLIASELQGIPNKELYDPESSVYHLAKSFFAGRVILREHFRCVPEIIQFSNDLSYDNKIKPLREPLAAAVKPALVCHRVKGATRGGKRNREEALEIASLIAACIELPQYQSNEMSEPTSFGVISLLGDEQALEIETILRHRIPPVEYERRRLLCGNAAQFQGDERDVMFLSVVDGPPDAPPHTMRGVGAKDMFKKRFNVAASRARNQMWVVHSLNHETDLQFGDMRRRLIEHALDPNALMQLIERNTAITESPFERDVLERLMRRNYKVVPQWPVGAYRIDLVVEGQNGRLAVECDGERWHSHENLEQDMQRQAILERLGWRFVRIRGSVFFRDPEGAMQPVFDTLERLKIEPILSKELKNEETESDLIDKVRRRAQELRRIWEEDDDGEDSEAIAKPVVTREPVARPTRTSSPEIVTRSAEVPERVRQPERSLGIQVGDSVKFIYLDAPMIVEFVQITEDATNQKLGTINDHTPLAVALLGRLDGEQVVERQSGGERKLKITEIYKLRRRA